MVHEFLVLGETNNGKILKCNYCLSKVAFMYKNITQCFLMEDFYQLKEAVDKIDVEGFFMKYPEENKLHMRTEFRDLFFSFTGEEIYELKELLTKAHYKIKMYENIQNNLN